MADSEADAKNGRALHGQRGAKTSAASKNSEE